MPLYGEDAWDHARFGLMGGELPVSDWFQIAYDSGTEADILSIIGFSTEGCFNLQTFGSGGWNIGECIGVGEDLFAGTSTSGLILTSVDGTTWTLAYDSPQTRINTLHVFNTDIYAATGPNGVIYKSSDGSVWTLAYDGPDTDILTLETFGSDLYHAGTDGVIRRSSDGTTWTLAYDSGAQADTIYDLEVFDSQLYACSGDSLGIIFRSSDGTTWTLAYDSDQSVVQSLGATLSDFPSGSPTLVAGSGDQFRVYKTTDGTTWTLSYDGLGTLGDVRVLHVTAGMIYAGTELLGVLYRSSNAVDWSISYDSPETEIHAIASFGANPDMYIGTGNSGIIYSMDNYVEIDGVPDTISPDGGETITTDTFVLEWSVEATDLTNIVFDIEFTRNFSTNRDWTVAVDDLSENLTGISTSDKVTVNGNQLEATWNVLPIVDSSDMKIRIRARDISASNASWNESDDVFTLQNGPC